MFVCFSDVLNPYAKEIWQLAFKNENDFKNRRFVCKYGQSESRFLSFFSHNYKIAYGSI